MAIEAPEKPTTESQEPPRQPFAGRVNTQITGATLTGLRPAEDMIIPGVEDVIAEAESHHKPEGSDPLSDQTMILNMGPQHPSTHGVLRLVIELDGETVVSLAPDIGYLHTGIEKTCEAKFYQQVVPLTDRIDYLAPMINNTAYALAVEKLLQLEIPPRAQWLRVLFNELSRINSHLVWLGTHAMDIGALTVFLYCFREREQILRYLRGGERAADDDELHPHRRRGDGAADRSVQADSRVPRRFPVEDRRVRRAAERESDLDGPAEGRWAPFV